MADGTDPDRPNEPKKDDRDLADVRDRLDALEGKLDAHRTDPVAERAAKMERTNFGMAVRVSSDFIAAIFVGGALGWFLDSVAGTSPFGLVILLLLGFAAGVLNVMRTLGLVAMPTGFQSGGRQAQPGAKNPPPQARRHDTEENSREGR